MEQTPLPTPQQLQEKIDRNISEATERYQSAITNPNTLPTTLQPVMHPVESFFAPPSSNPRLTTCLVCAAPFPTHEQLCQHVELHHPTVYNPPHVQFPPNLNQASPFAAPGTVFPVNSMHSPSTMADPWTSVSAVQAAISLPSGKPLQQYRCNVCDVGCDTMLIFNTHLKGQKHRKKVELREAFQKAAPNLHVEGISEVNPGLWVCKLCTTGLESENAVLQHLDAIKHRRLRQNQTHNDKHKRLRTSPVAAAHTAEAAASTPVSAALAVLKDDNAPLPPVSSLFTPPIPSASRPASSYPSSGRYPAQPFQPDRSGNIPPLPQPSHPGAPRAPISKNPRPPPANSSSRQTAPSFSCSVCSVTCNSMDSLNAHLASPRHKRKQNMVEAASNPSAAPPQASPQNIRCEVCGVNICGQSNFEAHLKGRQHARKLRMLGQKPPSGAAEPSGSASISPVPSPPRNSQGSSLPSVDRLISPIQPPIQQNIQPPLPTGFSMGAPDPDPAEPAKSAQNPPQANS